MLRVLILFLALGAQAQAGPWPRGDKKVFFSAHGNTEVTRDLLPLRQYATVYAEYGLNDRITLGLDFSGGEHSKSSGQVGFHIEKAIVFVRIPIASRHPHLRFAAEIGAGLIENKSALRPGFSVGRGITLFKRHGWITLDTRAVLPGSGGDSRIEADFTFGLGITERTKLILQLQGGMPSEGDSYLKFAPSIVFEQKPGKQRGKRKGRKDRKARKPRKGKRFVEIGVIAGLHNYDNFTAKVGIWREF